MDRDPSCHASAASAPYPSSPSSSSSSPGFFSTSRRPTPLTKSAMGQTESVPRAHPSPVHVHQVLPPAQPPSKYRFGWPGRRKKSEDLTKVMSRTSPPSPTPTPSASPSKGKDKEMTRLDTFASQANESNLHLHELSRRTSRGSAKQLTLNFASNTLAALKGKLNASQSSVHTAVTPPWSPPPPLPPKPENIYLSSSSSRGRPSVDRNTFDRREPLPQTPSTIANVTEVETQPEVVSFVVEDFVKVPQRRQRRDESQSARDIAEDWRKSDSTLRTVRLVGSRTPRPLSLAESTNSGHTVQPSAGSPSANIGASKRLSALMADVDFGMPEVDSEDESACESVPSSALSSIQDVRNVRQQQFVAIAASSRSSSPTSASKASSRRSLSIRIGRLSGSKSRAVPSDQLSGSDSDAFSSSVSTHGLHTANSSTTSVTSSPSAKDSAMLEPHPSVEIASTSSVASDMSDTYLRQYEQYQGKLEPWISAHKASESQTSLSTSASSHTGSLSREQPAMLSVSHGPSIRPAHQRTRLQSIQSKGFRQTAVSLTTGLAPAAGFAKKAVDKLGRALGGSATSLGNSADYYAHLPSATQRAGHNASASSSSFFGMMGRSPGAEQYQHPHHANPHHADQNHARAHGQQTSGHAPRHASKALRKHAQNAPSGTWSIGSNSNSLSDTDGSVGQGPNLGRLMRAPLYAGCRGLVFGRDLAQCVQDTVIEGDIGGDTDMLSLEGRRLPALVTRCAQHIVKWGVQEEGLFRISGRSTHVAKLRAEFDAGTDYDLRECGPGEIDPHAVSSIFKAYLRELPEPLLTRNLMPYFEAALSAENTMVIAAEAQSSNHGNGSSFEKVRSPGLPSGPRDVAQVRKAPSLSTFAVPMLAPRTASDSLLHALTSLIARLPQENRDLLRTVAELISATAHCSKDTKMPLSNLLLVFCPSLMMSPPLLRVLCEGERIWDGPPKDAVPDVKAPGLLGAKEEDIVPKGDIGEEDEGEGKGESGLRSQRTIRRCPRTSPDLVDGGDRQDPSKEIEAAPVPPITLALPDGVPSTSSDPSSASGNSKSDSLLGIAYILNSPPNSSESFSTPLSSGTSSSGTDSPANGSGFNSPGGCGKPPALRVQSDLPSPSGKGSVRKSLIGHPIPFPLGGGSAPVTPSELSSHLRLPNYSSSSPNLQGATTNASLYRRKSKASLQGLFPKRSLSSLLGFAQLQSQPAPSEMMFAELESVPVASINTLCPVLKVDMSPTQLRLDLCNAALTEEPEALSDKLQASDLGSMPRPQAEVMNRAASDSSALTSSVFYTPPTTTRALAPAVSLASSSSSGSYSLLDFSLSQGAEDDDWAQSVLQAAASEA